MLNLEEEASVLLENRKKRTLEKVNKKIEREYNIKYARSLRGLRGQSHLFNIENEPLYFF